MLVPLSWLKQFVELDEDATSIADRLAMLGFPVDEIRTRPLVTGVVAGKITALEKHPNAGDRLLTIATAANNVAAGQIVPIATIGAQLPQLRIEPRKMRGIASEGMMVSADELALPPDWFEDGIMQLEAGVSPGTDVVDYFGLADAVFDVEITSNRVDTMCVIGLARELAASYGRPLRLPAFDNPGTQDEPRGEAPEVVIESPDCTRFVAQRFDGIRVAAAPAWMRVRLALAGQRPINNLVDVSNYVMLETGQPLHFYDAASIRGGRLFVRDARPQEKTVTLDDAERELGPQSLVIADADRVLCLAGLMGARAGEVSDATEAIVLEAASFDGTRIRRMSQALGVRTEASSRHEKMLAPALTDAGAARAAQLLTAMGATAYRPHAFGAPPPPAQSIELHAADVERLLGLRLSPQRIAAHLEALGCAVAALSPDGDALLVTPPPWRCDLTIAADAIEEVARVEGYDGIPSIVPSVPAHEISSAQYDCEWRIATTLAALGYREIVNYALDGGHLDLAAPAPSGHAVEILNPLSEDQRFLRRSLTPALLEYFARLDAPARIFEIGHVFAREEGGRVNETAVAEFGFTAEPLDEPPWRDAHFLRLKGDCEAFLRGLSGRRPAIVADARSGLHPGKSASALLDGREVACLGRVDPRWAKAFGIRLPAYLCTVFVGALPDYAVPRYRPPSRLPSTYRDLALVVTLDVPAAAVERTVAETLGALCTGVRVFDEYRGPQVGDGRKSLAVRVTLTRPDATITDEEADEAIARVLTALREQFDATIRE